MANPWRRRSPWRWISTCTDQGSEARGQGPEVRSQKSDVRCPRSEVRGPFFSAALDGAAQRLCLLPNRVAQILSQIGAHVADALSRFAHSFFDLFRGTFGPLADGILGVVVAALDIAAQLASALGREQKPDQRPGSQSNQQERNGRTHAAAFRRFITSDAHDEDLNFPPA